MGPGAVVRGMPKKHRLRSWTAGQGEVVACASARCTRSGSRVVAAPLSGARQLEGLGPLPPWWAQPFGIGHDE
jgi:hypothetical protein